MAAGYASGIPPTSPRSDPTYMARLCDLDPAGPTATAEISAALSSLASRQPGP